MLPPFCRKDECKMDAYIHACALLATWLYWLHSAVSYNIRHHPCCQDVSENLTLAMVIDAFEIYGHDPTDKLDNLWLYQTEMMSIRTAEDQYMINEKVHVATDHLGRFVNLHVKELKVLLIALDDAIDNMLTMYENHNAIAAERKATYNGGPVPMEFYMSQEYHCGKNVYIFVSELYSDIYNMGRGPAPYCKDRSFAFLGFLHYHDEQKYYLLDDPGITFPTDNYMHGLECHIGVCIFRFPFKKLVQNERDVVTLPKAIVKCGLIMYKLPPLSAVSCIVTSGTFIFDFNIQGVRYRHHDYILMIPNGATYYTKEKHTPLFCDHHVCEWNYTNPYGGPFVEDPTIKVEVPPVLVEPTPAPPDVDPTPPPDIPFLLDGCLFMYPPNYGSIAGISYLDSVDLHQDRFTCVTNKAGLYWYPQWMGAMPHHPYESLHNVDPNRDVLPSAVVFPHQQDMQRDELADLN